VLGLITGYRLLATLGFGASAWSVAGRDCYIGWTAKQRRSNLHLIVNNARFLILPWVRSRNLASKILSLACKQIRDDWQAKYNYSPVLLETFVEIDLGEPAIEQPTGCKSVLPKGGASWKNPSRGNYPRNTSYFTLLSKTSKSNCAGEPLEPLTYLRTR